MYITVLVLQRTELYVYDGKRFTNDIKYSCKSFKRNKARKILEELMKDSSGDTFLLISSKKKINKINKKLSRRKMLRF